METETETEAVADVVAEVVAPVAPGGRKGKAGVGKAGKADKAGKAAAAPKNVGGGGRVKKVSKKAQEAAAAEALADAVLGPAHVDEAAMDVDATSPASPSTASPAAEMVAAEPSQAMSEALVALVKNAEATVADMIQEMEEVEEAEDMTDVNLPRKPVVHDVQDRAMELIVGVIGSTVQGQQAGEEAMLLNIKEALETAIEGLPDGDSLKEDPAALVASVDMHLSKVARWKKYFEGPAVLGMQARQLRRWEVIDLGAVFSEPDQRRIKNCQDWRTKTGKLANATTKVVECELKREECERKKASASEKDAEKCAEAANKAATALQKAKDNRGAAQELLVKLKAARKKALEKASEKAAKLGKVLESKAEKEANRVRLEEEKAAKRERLEEEKAARQAEKDRKSAEKEAARLEKEKKVAEKEMLKAAEVAKAKAQQARMSAGLFAFVKKAPSTTLSTPAVTPGASAASATSASPSAAGAAAGALQSPAAATPGAVTSATAPSSSSSLTSGPLPSTFDGEALESALSTGMSHRDLLLDLRERYRNNRSSELRRPRVHLEVASDVANVFAADEEKQNTKTVTVDSHFRLVHFSESTRPHYFGTVSQSFAEVSGRRPLGEIPDVEYNYDSNDDWSDEGEGENIDMSDGEEDDEGNDYEYNDFFKQDNDFGSDVGSDDEERAAAIVRRRNEGRTLIGPLMISPAGSAVAFSGKDVRERQDEVDVLARYEAVTVDAGAVADLKFGTNMLDAPEREKGSGPKVPVNYWTEAVLRRLAETVHGTKDGLDKIVDTFRVEFSDIPKTQIVKQVKDMCDKCKAAEGYGSQRWLVKAERQQELSLTLAEPIFTPKPIKVPKAPKDPKEAVPPKACKASKASKAAAAGAKPKPKAVSRKRVVADEKAAAPKPATARQKAAADAADALAAHTARTAAAALADDGHDDSDDDADDESGEPSAATSSSSRPSGALTSPKKMNVLVPRKKLRTSPTSTPALTPAATMSAASAPGSAVAVASAAVSAAVPVSASAPVTPNLLVPRKKAKTSPSPPV
jgi:hypothetical protein